LSTPAAVLDDSCIGFLVLNVYALYLEEETGAVPFKSVASEPQICSDISSHTYYSALDNHVMLHSIENLFF
jgi:hypothetical protein